MAVEDRWLDKFEFETTGKIPIKLDKKLILRQMDLNGLLLDEGITAMMGGKSPNKTGKIEVSTWGSENLAEVLLDNGVWKSHCADFLVANNEDELTTKDEMKRADAHFRHHYFRPGEEKFIGLREKALRPLKWRVRRIDGDEIKIGARVLKGKDEIYFNDGDYWLKHISPLIQDYKNEVEIYMALFDYSCSLDAGLHGLQKAYNDGGIASANQLERNVNGLLRMLRMNRKKLIVERKMPQISGHEVEEIYTKIFMNIHEVLNAKCTSAKGIGIDVKPFWVNLKRIPDY